VDGILRAPKHVVVRTHVPVSIAAARLATVLAERPRIEPTPSARFEVGAGLVISSDRHLVGQVDGVGVHLAVQDANIVSRRKSWNIEFDGAFESSGTGAILRGAIDIPDRIQLRVILWMFWFLSVFAAILAVGLAIRHLSEGQPVAIWPTVVAIVTVPVVVVATRRMETDGWRRAEDDARVMSAALARLMNE
jgi:hypothetical protein